MSELIFGKPVYFGYYLLDRHRYPEREHIYDRIIEEHKILGEEIHYDIYPGCLITLCKNKNAIFSTKDRNLVTCKKCIDILKNIPKKFAFNNDLKQIGKYSGKCKICGEHVSTTWAYHCPNCGNHIDWGAHSIKGEGYCGCGFPDTRKAKKS